MILKDYKSTNFITSLRAVAVLLVFFTHFFNNLKLANPTINFLSEIGKCGVEIFFVISGFTIFSQFFSEKYNFKNFIAIRLGRISIPYYPLLFLVIIYLLAGGHNFNPCAEIFNYNHLSITNIIAHIFYLNSFSTHFANTILGIEWTLGIEVFFYLFFGAIIALKIFKLKTVHFVIFGTFFFILFLSIHYLHFIKIIDYYTTIWLPFRYGYMFWLGGLAYYLRTFNYKKDSLANTSATKKIIILTFIISIILIFSNLFIVENEQILQLIFTLFTFLIIWLYNNQGILTKFFNNKIIIFLGSISYSFYLIHFMVIKNTPKIDGGLLDFIAQFGTTVLLSYMWYYCFEKVIYGKFKQFIKNRPLKLKPII